MLSRMISRRAFMGVLPAASLIHLAFELPQGPAQPAWYQSMRRCGQLNLNERDPLTLNVTEWIDYWASLKLDALLLNGGGILAFYPTEVPYHHRSEFLGTRDLFGELTAAARRRGMKVVARDGLQLRVRRGPARAPGMVRTQRRRLPAPAWRSAVAVQDLHVQPEFSTSRWPPFTVRSTDAIRSTDSSRTDGRRPAV